MPRRKLSSSKRYSSLNIDMGSSASLDDDEIASNFHRKLNCYYEQSNEEADNDCHLNLTQSGERDYNRSMRNNVLLDKQEIDAKYEFLFRIFVKKGGEKSNSFLTKYPWATESIAQKRRLFRSERFYLY